MNKIQITSHTLIVFTIVVSILYLGQSIIIPLIFGGILWLLMRKIRSLFYLLRIHDRIFPKALKTLLSTAILFASIWFIGLIFERNIQELISHYEIYNFHFAKLMHELNQHTSFSLEKITSGFDFNNFFSTYVPSALQSVQSIISNIVIILIYMLFIISEESSFKSKIRAISYDPENYENRLKIIQRIEKAITNYLGIKSLLATISATIGYFIFILLDLHAPFFWALLIFILSFIPFVGVLVSAFLPALFAIAQFGGYTESLIILFSTGAVQFVSGNIIEPKIMGNSMNVSPLVVILSLVFWGLIWGLPGMFLSVPITVILVIILSKFEATRIIAIMLSEKGEIDPS